MIKPLGNKVLIKPDEEQKTTASGIIIPDTVKEEMPKSGTIVAVGDGKRNIGERVLFSRFAMEQFEEDGKPFCIVDEEGLLGIYE